MINDDVEALRQEHRKDTAGARERLYLRFGRAMALARKLRPGGSRARTFYKLANKKIPKRSVAKLSKNPTAALICYITCANNENAVKQAWKRARALDYLCDNQGVQPGNIATEIKKRGGMEAIVKVAAAEFPRRKKIAAVSKGCLGKMPKQQLNKNSLLEEQTKPEQSNWDNVKLADHKGHSDDGEMVRMYVSRATKAKIMAVPPGDDLKLICTRLDEGSTSEVVAMIKKARPLEN